MMAVSTVPLAAASQLAAWIPIAVLIVIVLGMVGAMGILAHTLGPRHRHGKIKDMPYESGMDPQGSARKRFNIKFYLIAMIFLLFDVEIVFFFPWVKMFAQYGTEPVGPAADALLGDGYGGLYMLIVMGLFMLTLVEAYIYAVRKRVFEW